MSATRKYLSRYAEPEATYAARVSRGYDAALIVPALAERAELLDGFVDAASSLSGGVLVILVVNAALGVDEALVRANQRLLEALADRSAGRRELGPGCFIATMGELDVLVLDRSGPGRALPPKQGVGLARKIGMDLGLALYARSQLSLPWLFTTDADARLPADYFAGARACDPSSSALLFPFEHVGEPNAVTEATTLYELSLRYRVLGLSFAGSPYAYASVGSALAAHVEAYAAVRGVPKRQAGEDFYLLDKLAKLGPLERVRASAVQITARRSHRVPFGTGPEVAKVIERGALTVTAPGAFAVLRAVLTRMEGFAAQPEDATLHAALAPGLTGVDPRAVDDALSALGYFRACREAAREVGTGSLRRRLFTWFDGLKTLRFLHHVRVLGLPDCRLEEALSSAPFVPPVPLDDAASALERLVELERALPTRIGPSLLT